MPNANVPQKSQKQCKGQKSPTEYALTCERMATYSLILMVRTTRTTYVVHCQKSQSGHEVIASFSVCLRHETLL